MYCGAVELNWKMGVFYSTHMNTQIHQEIAYTFMAGYRKGAHIPLYTLMSAYATGVNPSTVPANNFKSDPLRFSNSKMMRGQ